MPNDDLDASYRYQMTIKMFGSHPEPGFESREQQLDVWGRQWGCDNDVGQIRMVLMHRPGPEMSVVDPSKRIESIGTYGDLEHGWYWQSEEIPPLAEMQKQHDALAQVLRDEGAEVVYLESVEKDGIKSCYTRDSAFAVKGGAIVGRMARKIRRGEEAHVTRTLAGLGMPILRTVAGTGLAEGGSFAWLNSKTAAIGSSICVNEEGVRQVEEVLRHQGVELICVDLPGYDIHLDISFTMIDVDLAIVNPMGLPFWFLEKLKELKIRTIEISPQDSSWIVNCLAVRPGRVIMPRGISNRTMDALVKHNVEVIQIDYDKMSLNGGGIHCSTCPLIRDSVD